MKWKEMKGTTNSLAPTVEGQRADSLKDIKAMPSVHAAQSH